MNMRVLAIVAALAVLVSCTDGVAPSIATIPSDANRIVNGTWDGSGHPSVGALLYDLDGNGVTGFDLYCSGSLIAPTVFLTAAHCVAGVSSGVTAYVTFDSDLLDNGAVPSGVITALSRTANPAYFAPPFSGNSDLAVVILPAGSTAGITPVALATAGLLDGLSAKGGLRGSSFENVGYGTSATRAGPPVFPWNGKRNVSLAPFMGLTQALLGLLINTNATGQGGDCYGDSGSPKFIPGTNTIVAITSWGDLPCRATSWSPRLDTGAARRFLGSYVTLP